MPIFFLYREQVTVLSVINFKYVVLSEVTVTDLGCFVKSSGFIYSCLRKLVLCANLSNWKPVFSSDNGDFILISSFSRASVMMSFAIARWAFDNIMHLAGFISLRNSIFILSMYLDEWLLIISSTICLFLKNMQDLLLEIPEAKIMLCGSVI